MPKNTQGNLNIMSKHTVQTEFEMEARLTDITLQL